MLGLSGTETGKIYIRAENKEELLKKALEQYPTSKPANKSLLGSRPTLIDPIYPEPMMIIEVI